jgi:polyphosphate kinase 2 (PPK2 family)
MIERDKRYKEIRARGFDFEDHQIFDTFLERIEELSKQHNTPEINFYHAFEKKLKQAGGKIVPVVGAAQVSVVFKPEYNKDPTKKYKISKIDVSYIPKLKEYKNSRYS